MNEKSFFFTQLPVFGQIGPKTVMDRSVHPPRIQELHCVIDVLPSSDTFEVFPCIIFSGRILAALLAAECSGFAVRGGLFEASEIFNELRQGSPIPELRWCEITGVPYKDDLGLARQTRLIVSEKAKTVIESKEHDGVTFTLGEQVPTDAEITASLFEGAARVAEELRKKRRRDS
ncbi:MAG: hypothetical protein DME24_04660 [Verrucomicrobia bacterium]|nr:MAG: hypothetical protein DME24_04660 [Verrucomicrobiota bacterium]